MIDTTGLTQSREAGLNPGGLLYGLLHTNKISARIRPQRVIRVIPKGSLKIPS